MTNSGARVNDPDAVDSSSVLFVWGHLKTTRVQFQSKGPCYSTFTQS